MTTTLAAPPETLVSVAAEELARLEELVALRNSIDAEIADTTRAFARAEVDRRLDQIAAEHVTVEQVEASIVDRLGHALHVSPTRARTQLRIHVLDRTDPHAEHPGPQIAEVLPCQRVGAEGIAVVRGRR